ncbi:MAG: hypothetical protein K9N47_23130 [Prosthecobacter sp.]|uniref:hypothetical protein n=1 Tax=Prosthecobacter sp. TaxID=1965333 RepID=UPI002613390D|nr:hypothetical protein [Prosthecobacter sp.]MCF7789037.1 hypothetical protein [Prosthecobacter sp.]
MNPSAIHRQHETTCIPELAGQVCSAFKAVSHENSQIFGVFYMQLSGAWYRFFLDAGLLFWQDGPAPDPYDDLLDGEAYIDLGNVLGVVGSSITEISMHDCQLLLQFENGARLTLRNGVEEVGATAVELVARK